MDPLAGLTSGFSALERLGGGGGFSDDDGFDSDALGAYADAKKTVATKKRAREEVKEQRVRERAEAAGAASSEEEVEGERKATKSILKNRGLMKYRNKDRKYVHCCHCCSR